MGGQKAAPASLPPGGNPYVPPRMHPALSVFLPVLLLAGLARAQDPDPFLRDLDALVESGLAEERRLYFLKCQSALESRDRHRRDALIGMAFFLADIPLEFASSRIVHEEKRHPAGLNAVAFVLMGVSLYHLARSNRHFEDYARDRAACRCWQDYARRD
jgi:hypothetical protein